MHSEKNCNQRDSNFLSLNLQISRFFYDQGIKKIKGFFCILFKSKPKIVINLQTDYDNNMWHDCPMGFGFFQLRCWCPINPVWVSGSRMDIVYKWDEVDVPSPDKKSSFFLFQLLSTRLAFFHYSIERIKSVGCKMVGSSKGKVPQVCLSAEPVT